MENAQKRLEEELRRLWEQATPEQRYIILRFVRNIVKTE